MFLSSLIFLHRLVQGFQILDQKVILKFQFDLYSSRLVHEYIRLAFLPLFWLEYTLCKFWVEVFCSDKVWIESLGCRSIKMGSQFYFYCFVLSFIVPMKTCVHYHITLCFLTALCALICPSIFVRLFLAWRKNVLFLCHAAASNEKSDFDIKNKKIHRLRLETQFWSDKRLLK